MKSYHNSRADREFVDANRLRYRIYQMAEIIKEKDQKILELLQKNREILKQQKLILEM